MDAPLGVIRLEGIFLSRILGGLVLIMSLMIFSSWMELMLAVTLSDMRTERRSGWVCSLESVRTSSAGSSDEVDFWEDGWMSLRKALTLASDFFLA
jgi:hypothetical protein